MKHTPILFVALVACSTDPRTGEPPSPVVSTPPLVTTTIQPDADQVARAILEHDGVACTADGRRCVTTLFERDGEGGDRQAYQVIEPGAVAQQTSVYDHFEYDGDYDAIDAAVAAARAQARPALAALLRDGGFVAVPTLDASLDGEVAVAQGTLRLGQAGAIVDLDAAGARRPALSMRPRGGSSLLAASQQPGSSMAVVRIQWSTTVADDNTATTDVAYLIELDPRARLRRVLAGDAFACNADRCLAARTRRGEGGGDELGLQVLTPGKTVDDQVVCDGDLADCDDDGERAAAIEQAIAAHLADAADASELVPTAAAGGAVALAVGTLAIEGDALRLGKRRLGNVPAGTTVRAAAAAPGGGWVIATLDLAPPGDGRGGAATVTRMYAAR